MSNDGEHQASDGWNADVVRARAMQHEELENFLAWMRERCGDDDA